MYSLIRAEKRPVGGRGQRVDPRGRSREWNQSDKQMQDWRGVLTGAYRGAIVVKRRDPGDTAWPDL